MSVVPHDAIDAAVSAVRVELAAAYGEFAPMASPHEGVAVIFEELGELWACAVANRGRSIDARDEALQVAAMAIRYAVDLCLDPEVPARRSRS